MATGQEASKPRGWTAEEDAQIIRLFNEVGPRRTAIAAVLEGRTDASVRSRHHRLMSHDGTAAQAGARSIERYAMDC